MEWGNLENPGFASDLPDPIEFDIVNARLQEANPDYMRYSRKTLEIKTVYPGHGKPFRMEQFMGNNQ